MSFDSLGLSNYILQAIEKQGYTTPSPIQKQAIPYILEGRDVLASAQTGTGKTAGFTLPILEKLSEKSFSKNRPIRSLVLTPTRELAAQIQDNIINYSEFLDIRSTVIFGGVKQTSQVNKLRQGVDILVATPGRLLDLHNQRLLNLSKIEILVLDEADRMLDMGFLRDIKKIVALLPKKRQNLLFSATYSKEIKALSTTFLNNPAQVSVTPQNTTVEIIDQKAYRVDKVKKAALLIQLIKENAWPQALIFTRTKHGANKLVQKLERAGLSSAAIHGNKSQNQRTKALDGFKKGKVKFLVATDIAARGLDIPLLPHVVNYELPNVPEDYVHRIGRTGRAGASGEALSLVDIEEVAYVRSIEKLTGEKIQTEILEGFEPQNNTPTGKKPTQNKRRPSGANKGKKSFGKSFNKPKRRSSNNY